MIFDNLIHWLNNMALSVYPISFDFAFLTLAAFTTLRNSTSERISKPFSWNSEWAIPAVKRENRDQKIERVKKTSQDNYNPKNLIQRTNHLTINYFTEKSNKTVEKAEKPLHMRTTLKIIKIIWKAAFSKNSRL